MGTAHVDTRKMNSREAYYVIARAVRHQQKAKAKRIRAETERARRYAEEERLWGHYSAER